MGRLDRTDRALLRTPSPRSGSLPGMLPAGMGFPQSRVPSPLQKTVAVEKPCVSITAA